MAIETLLDEIIAALRAKEVQGVNDEVMLYHQHKNGWAASASNDMWTVVNLGEASGRYETDGHATPEAALTALLKLIREQD